MPTTPYRTKAIAPETFVRQVERAYYRLVRVTIECLDFEAFMCRYDRPTTLFYLDPPYWRCEDYYGKGMFERGDFDRLAGVLRHLRGRFILSLNDVPEVWWLFAWATIEEEPVTYKFNGTKKVTELVISNRQKGR